MGDWWIDPSGKEFIVDTTHDEWVAGHKDLLKETYGIDADDKEDLRNAGWTYISFVRWYSVIGNPSIIPHFIKEMIIFDKNALVVNDDEYNVPEEKEQALSRHASLKTAEVAFMPGDRIVFYFKDDPYDPETRQQGVVTHMTDVGIGVEWDDVPTIQDHIEVGFIDTSLLTGDEEFTIEKVASMKIASISYEELQGIEIGDKVLLVDGQHIDGKRTLWVVDHTANPSDSAKDAIYCVTTKNGYGDGVTLTENDIKKVKKA